MQQMQLTLMAVLAALKFGLPADTAAYPAVRVSTGVTLKSDTGVWLKVSARR